MAEPLFDDAAGGVAAARADGFQRVAAALAQRGHPHPPCWLEVAARTAQEAAGALGVALGQIAKSVVFRRRADGAAVLVVTSGDRRVDEKKVAARTGALGRADPAFVKAATGFAIGGVPPVAALTNPASPTVTLIDAELFRFDVVWAAAGHPNGVFQASPAQLAALTGAPVADVVVVAAAAAADRPSEAAGGALTAGVPSPCTNVCRIDAVSGWCEGCQRSVDEIGAWSAMNDAQKTAVWAQLAGRRTTVREASAPRPDARSARSPADGG